MACRCRKYKRTFATHLREWWSGDPQKQLQLLLFPEAQSYTEEKPINLKTTVDATRHNIQYKMNVELIASFKQKPEQYFLCVCDCVRRLFIYLFIYLIIGLESAPSRRGAQHNALSAFTVVSHSQFPLTEKSCRSFIANARQKNSTGRAGKTHL